MSSLHQSSSASSQSLSPINLPTEQVPQISQVPLQWSLRQPDTLYLKTQILLLHWINKMMSPSILLLPTSLPQLPQPWSNQSSTIPNMEFGLETASLASWAWKTASLSIAFSKSGPWKIYFYSKNLLLMSGRIISPIPTTYGPRPSLS